jgi:hypothetical protein
MNSDIQDFKELAVFGAAFAKAYIKANEDGDIGLDDIVYIMPLLQAAGPAIDNIADVLNELKDIDVAEEKEIQQILENEFIGISDQVTDITSEVFQVILGVARIVSILKKDSE